MIDGHELNDIQLGSLRDNIALVSQDVVLFNDTVAANIAYGRLSHTPREAIVRAAEAAHAMEFIRNMPQGLDTLIGENGIKLSGGQRQRLAIARALLKDAPILILDEATSALDSESERLVQAALENLMKNRTTIVIAHRLSTIERADRIVVMQNGRVIEMGSHDRLIAKKEPTRNCTGLSSPERKLSNSPPERIPRDARVLVICVARIGDTLLNTARAASYQNSVSRRRSNLPRTSETLRGIAGLNVYRSIVGITKKTAWWQGRLGSKRWDYALVYGKDDALFDYARRAAHRVVGFARPEAESSGHAFDVSVTPPASTSHAVDERLMLPQAIGIYAQSKRLLYRVSALERDTAEAWISHRISGGATNLVGLQFASFPTKAYRDWPIDYVIALWKRIWRSTMTSNCFA